MKVLKDYLTLKAYEDQNGIIPKELRKWPVHVKLINVEHTTFRFLAYEHNGEHVKTSKTLENHFAKVRFAPAEKAKPAQQSRDFAEFEVELYNYSSSK